MLDCFSHLVLACMRTGHGISQRGDGFPLAHMLAIVAAQVKDIVPVLTAHIYTVCPTAIPTLPLTVSTDTTNLNSNSEDDFMTQLGMIRQKDGNFESFERFLSRTEVSSCLLFRSTGTISCCRMCLRWYIDLIHASSVRSSSRASFH